MFKGRQSLVSLSMVGGLLFSSSSMAQANSIAGYLYDNGTAMEFIQMTSSGGYVQGKIIIDEPNAAGFSFITNTYNFKGIRNGNTLSIIVEGNQTISGQFSKGNLILEMPQSDGSLSQLTLKPASINTYNQDLAQLKQAFHNSQNVQANESTVDSDIQQLSIDVQEMSKDYSTAVNNLKYMQSSLRQGNTLFVQIQKQGNTVLGDTKPGNVDWTMYEGFDGPDASYFESTNTDYEQMDQNVGGLINLSWTWSEGAGGQYGYTIISSNQLLQDIKKYSSDYETLVRDEAKVPSYRPNPGIPSKSAVNSLVKVEQERNKVFTTDLAQAKELQNQYSNLESQVKAYEIKIQAAISDAAATAKATQPAPSLRGILDPGNSPDSVQVAIVSDYYDPLQNHLAYALVSTPTRTPYAGSQAPSELTTINNFDYVNVGNSPYIDIYVVDKKGQVVAFTELQTSH